MRLYILLAHPDPGSFNHAVAARARQTAEKLGHQVDYHDLYAEKFDAILPAAELQAEVVLDETLNCHCQQVQNAEGLIIVHPNWWGQPPAILKGWIDRVLRAGIAYRFLPGDKGEGIPVGLLKIRTAIIFNTSNTPHEREQAVFGDPLESLWKKCILEFCGIPRVLRRMFHVIVSSSPEERQHWLQEVAGMVEQAFPKGK